MQKEFQNMGIARGQKLFKLVDLVIAGFIDFFGLKVVNLDDQNLFIMAAIKQNDFALCRGLGVNAP
jgi:hypothetical protein